MTESCIRPGLDNYGKPKQAYCDKLAAMTDKQLLKQTELDIWLAAYANNNLGSDSHWQAAACSDEAQRRGKPEIYRQAWKNASST